MASISSLRIILCQSGFLILKLVNMMFIGWTAKCLRKPTKTVCTAESYLCYQYNPCSLRQTYKQVYHALRESEAVLLLLKR